MSRHRLLRSPHFLLIFLLAVGLLGLAACGSSGSAVVEPTAVAPPVSEQAIPWDEASGHIGETTTIEGPVVTAVYSDTSTGEPTFLNVGRDYPDPDRFTVVIWGDDRGSFPDAPESMYEGKTIRVTGEVSEYDGRAQIEVTWPDAIEVMD